MRINPKKLLMYLEDRLRHLKTYLYHPDTNLRYILSVIGLLCICGWFVINDEWLKALLLIGLVIVLTLSFTIFGYLGILVLNLIRKEQFNRKFAQKATILTLVLVTILVVFDVPLDLAVPIIAVMALRAVLTIVFALVAARK